MINDDRLLLTITQHWSSVMNYQAFLVMNCYSLTRLLPISSWWSARRVSEIAQLVTRQALNYLSITAVSTRMLSQCRCRAPPATKCKMTKWTVIHWVIHHYSSSGWLLHVVAGIRVVDRWFDEKSPWFRQIVYPLIWRRVGSWRFP